jgi:hypothetical protein
MLGPHFYLPPVTGFVIQNEVAHICELSFRGGSVDVTNFVERNVRIEQNDCGVRVAIVCVAQSEKQTRRIRHKLTRHLILCPNLSTRTTNGLLTKLRSLTAERFKGDPAICSRAAR